MTKELAKARADVEHDIVGLDIALEEMRAEDTPDRILRAAVGLGKTRGVERVETQRITRGFCMPSDIIACPRERGSLRTHACEFS